MRNSYSPGDKRRRRKTWKAVGELGVGDKYGRSARERLVFHFKLFQSSAISIKRGKGDYSTFLGMA